jgi:hypothetical protein
VWKQTAIAGDTVEAQSISGQPLYYSDLYIQNKNNAFITKILTLKGLNLYPKPVLEGVKTTQICLYRGVTFLFS